MLGVYKQAFLKYFGYTIGQSPEQLVPETQSVYMTMSRLGETVSFKKLEDTNLTRQRDQEWRAKDGEYI